MMGIYLTWLGNQKEDAATGRVPDLNFAREITQLFTIGEWMLNAGRQLHPRFERQAGGRLHRRRSGRPRAGLHRLQLVRRSEHQRPHEPPLLRQRREPRARLAADAGLQRVRAEHRVPLGQPEDLPRRDDPGADQGRQRGRPEDRARHAVQPSERRPVHRQAADPAHGHEQPEPGLRRSRHRGVQRQRQRRARRHEGGLARDPARPGGAQHELVVDLRQAARAGGPPRQLHARVQRELDQRPLHRHRPDRRPGDLAEPDAGVRADRLQLLPARLRADQQGDHRRRPGRARDADHARRLGRRLHELHAQHRARSARRATSGRTTAPRSRWPATRPRWSSA